MIISDDSASRRLNSPLNLINRLKNVSSRSGAMQLFTGPKNKDITVIPNPFAKKEAMPSADTIGLPERAGAQHPAENTATLDNILENSDTQIKLGLAHDSALELLTKSVSLLSAKLDDVSASKLPQAISAASKVVESIRRERTEASKNTKDREVHYHFYTPNQRKVEEYEVIDVT